MIFSAFAWLDQILYCLYVHRYVFPEDEDTASSDSIYDMELSGTTNKVSQGFIYEVHAIVGDKL